MILVDSSVWIDYFRGSATPQANRLDGLLQGFATDREFNDARKVLLALDMVVLGGPDVAVEAAKNYRKLRSLGVTVRKTIDTVIATRCIVSGHMLLHNDRDFDAFEQHLGLRCVTSGAYRST